MKKNIIYVIIPLLLITVGLCGCTEQKTSDQTNIDTTPPTVESLESILEKAETVGSLYYEVTATITMPQVGTQTATIKIWQKLPYIKEQVTSSFGGIPSSMTVIHRPDGNYTYDSTLNKYLLTQNATSFADSMRYFDSDMIKKYLENQTNLDLERDVIDGKQATIIQYTPPGMMGTQMTIKLWIWNEKGLPLKAHIDMTMEQTTMNMDFVFTNYSFQEIPDSTFNVG